ncbi:MAG: flagellin [Rhodobacteraceae bacterium]|jgi:flagellin|nr:flagellin [Paracoccaceae bacterium]
MSSILTNTSAMVALQTLKGINQSLNKTQNEISTGKSVATAKDNAAVWAISKVMESDVTGFKGISDSLSLGESTVAVARQAAETVTDLLTEIKGKIVAAQEENVDRAKIQEDVVALRDQIASVVRAAQFNGLNLVDGSQSTVNILASLDRDTGGNIAVSSIAVTAQDLSIGAYAANDVFAAGGGNAVVSTAADTFAMSLDNGGGSDEITVQDGTTPWAEGDRLSLTVAGQTVTYTVTGNDVDSGNNTVADLVAVGLKNKIDALGITGLTVDYDSASPGVLTFTNAGAVDLAVTGQFANAGSGGLGALAGIDVSSSGGASAALGNIEGLIQTAIDSSASFGSVQKRIGIQSDFVGKLVDSLKSGIGTMVDADMEEASARLQALQVQQQLGIQALSIANQAPQNILALFR